MQILVVEDEPKVANTLREGLEAEGYEVVLANTGEEGFFHANAHAFNLFVLDVMLPGRDGMEVLTTLRRQDEAKKRSLQRLSCGRTASRRTSARWRPLRSSTLNRA